MSKEAFRFDVATAMMQGGRDYQEDSLIANFPLGQANGFAILADGMGGQLAGDVASGLVISEAIGLLKMKEMALNDTRHDIPALLTEIAHAANQRISQHITDTPETHGMGSTLLGIVIRANQLFWVSVGDSPLLLYRDGALVQLNKDHSMAPQIDMMVKVGAMTEDVGRNHPDRNTLTSAITGSKIKEIDCPQEPTALLPGDTLIVASDGLQYLANDVIVQILEEHQNEHSVDTADAILAALDLLDDPDQDNATFTVIKLGERHTSSVTVPASDPSTVLTQLRDDLGRPADAAPDPTPPEPAIVDEVTPCTADTADMSAPRKIRLVTSKTRSFDAPPAEVAPASQEPLAQANKHDASLGWYRRHRLQND